MNILEILYDYYENNKKEKDDNGVNLFPKYGFANQNISFKLSLSGSGTYISFDIVSMKRFLPDLGALDIQRTNGISSNYFFDTEKYLLGSAFKSGKFSELSDPKKLDAFIKLHERILEETKNKDLKSVLKFLNTIKDKSFDLTPIRIVLEGLKGNMKKGGNIIISVDGRLLHEQKDLIGFWEKTIKDYKASYGCCMITGEKQALRKFHGKIKGLGGAAAGCSLVSYNINSHVSYNKGVPIGVRTEFGYRTALNYLLSSEMNHSKIDLQRGADVLVFWTNSLKDNFICKIIKLIFVRNKKEDEDILPKVKSAVESFKRGKLPDEIPENTKFFLAVISPNNGRVFIREFIDDPLSYTAQKVNQHCSDITMVGLPFPSLQSLAWASISDKAKKESPSKNIYKPLIQAVMKGAQYPENLVLPSLRLCMTPDGNQGYRGSARVCLLKGYLNRKYRTRNQKEITMSLDKEKASIGYLLGRVLAIADWILEVSIGHGGPNRTYNDMYRSSLGSSPRFVLKDLSDKVSAHLSKIKKNNPGKYVFFNSEYSEILDKINGAKDIPITLSLDDQIEFILGYQHQIQNRFKKKDLPKNDKEDSYDSTEEVNQ